MTKTYKINSNKEAKEICKRYPNPDNPFWLTKKFNNIFFEDEFIDKLIVELENPIIVKDKKDEISELWIWVRKSNIFKG